jgi:hypothetical protein
MDRTLLVGRLAVHNYCGQGACGMRLVKRLLFAHAICYALGFDIVVSSRQKQTMIMLMSVYYEDADDDDD